jgi:hypothetical protein
VRTDAGESASTAHHAWRSTAYIAARCDNKSVVPCNVATRRKIMVKKAKLALIATVALVGLASPALSQSFDEDDGTGNVLPFSSNRVAFENASHHAAARRNDMNSFAMEPRAPSHSNSNPYNASRAPAFDPRGTSAYPFGPEINFPYPDRPYGDPDHW